MHTDRWIAQSVLGFPVMMVGETILVLRLVAREELRLEREYGKRSRVYAQRVPRLLPSVRPRFEDEGQLPQWGKALWDQAFQWGLVATLLELETSRFSHRVRTSDGHYLR